MVKYNSSSRTKNEPGVLNMPVEKKPRKVRHPSKYSDELIPIFKKLLRDRGRVLDCFAGTGKLRDIRPDAVLVEIEPEWAKMCGAVMCDVRSMPTEWENTFDAICTSPTYGNRMADHHNAKDGSYRRTYKHCLGRDLSDGNSGSLQWGEAYKIFHEQAWRACHKVLKFRGILILNISDHIRKGKVIPVTKWHIDTLEHDAGFHLLEHHKVKTRRFRNGENSKSRVEYESILVFEVIK